jgi:hypothetical protein
MLKYVDLVTWGSTKEIVDMTSNVAAGPTLEIITTLILNDSDEAVECKLLFGEYLTGYEEWTKKDFYDYDHNYEYDDDEYEDFLKEEDDDFKY